MFFSVCLSVHGLSVCLSFCKVCLPVCLHGLFPTVFAQCSVHGGLSVWHSLSVCAQSDCMVCYVSVAWSICLHRRSMYARSVWRGLSAEQSVWPHGLSLWPGLSTRLHSLCARPGLCAQSVCSVCLHGLFVCLSARSVLSIYVVCLYVCLHGL